MTQDANGDLDMYKQRDSDIVKINPRRSFHGTQCVLQWTNCHPDERYPVIKVSNLKGGYRIPSHPLIASWTLRPLPRYYCGFDKVYRNSFQLGRGFNMRRCQNPGIARKGGGV